MNLSLAIKKLFRAIGIVYNALFYLFSACTLVLAVILVIALIMSFFGAGKTATYNMAYGVLAMVAIYIVGKTYYVIATWKKRRLKAKEDALNEEMQRAREFPQDTHYPPVQPPTMQRRQNPKRNLPPAQPVKAGNSRW